MPKIYLKSIDLVSEYTEISFIMEQKRTCYNGIYPFKIFPNKQLSMILFEPVTIFYGGNGSGKSTLLNIIAEKTKVKRHSAFSGGAFFDQYIELCSEKSKEIPPNSQILTSDDVFDYMLNIRYLNDGIDVRRNELFEDYLDRKYASHRGGFTMRRKIYEVIEVSDKTSVFSSIYDIIMLIAIAVSVLPLAMKDEPPFFVVTDYITTLLFIIDYALRWFTADYKLKKGPVRSFLLYPFTAWAIIDLASILPTLHVLGSGFKLLRLLRVSKSLRVFRIVKAMRYSKSLRIIIGVIRNSRDALLAVCTLAVSYIVISALVIFNVEGESFDNFFEAVYWATVSLTTVGYGDLYPVTTAGRIVAMVSSVFGIAIVALPAGIITAGYMRELEEQKKTEEKDDNS